jgi:homoserine dehydrogenase
VRLLYAASVGGGVPVLETLRRLAEGDDPVEAVRGVVNGTSNFVLDRVGEGESFDAAVKAAQAAGFAEADPTKDLDGTDAAEKLALAARAAFGVSPEEVEVGVIERRAWRRRWRCGATGEGPPAARCDWWREPSGLAEGCGCRWGRSCCPRATRWRGRAASETGW